LLSKTQKLKGLSGMKKFIVLLGVLILVLSSCKPEVNVVPTADKPVYQTIVTPVYQTVTTTLAPTATITPRQGMNFPVEFPIPILSQLQIQEVAECKIQELASKRYPERINTAELLKSC
jgi:hypothetical protein